MSRTASTTKTRKAKGRKLQNWVKQQLIDLGADESNIKVALMGEAGLDVICTNIVVECANQEKLNIWRKLDQLNYNADLYAAKHPEFSKLIRLLVFKRNQEEPYLAIPATLFMFLMASAITIQGTTNRLEGMVREAQLNSKPAGNA